jgi:hypothetical protein
MIAIADRLGHLFHPHTVAQGFAAWFRGGVSVTHESERAFFVDVRSRRRNDVRLLVEAGRLLTSCSCGAKDLGASVCKHLWAALLEADRRGVFPRLRATRARLAIGPLVDDTPLSKAPKRRTRKRKRKRDR